MQESMMIAEVGDMVNVSGSRMATPFAPPSPGSTPMITPSVMPSSMRPRFCRLSATAKPCMSDCRSSITPIASRDPERVFQRPLGQRHQEPALENEEEDDAVAD